MTLEHESLTLQLDVLQDKSKKLGDSLKTLADEGLDRLAKAAQAASSPRLSGYRKPEGDIVQSELSRMVNAEIFNGLQGLFATDATPQRSGGLGGMFSKNDGYNIVINNNSTASVSARETSDGFDRKSLEITIDQMVADSLLRGRQTSGVMRTLFGLTPTLFGR